MQRNKRPSHLYEVLGVQTQIRGQRAHSRYWGQRQKDHDDTAACGSPTRRRSSLASTATSIEPRAAAERHKAGTADLTAGPAPCRPRPRPGPATLSPPGPPRRRPLLTRHPGQVGVRIPGPAGAEEAAEAAALAGGVAAALHGASAPAAATSALP